MAKAYAEATGSSAYDARMLVKRALGQSGGELAGLEAGIAGTLAAAFESSGVAFELVDGPPEAGPPLEFGLDGELLKIIQPASPSLDALDEEVCWVHYGQLSDGASATLFFATRSDSELWRLDLEGLPHGRRVAAALVAAAERAGATVSAKVRAFIDHPKRRAAFSYADRGELEGEARLMGLVALGLLPAEHLETPGAPGRAEGPSAKKRPKKREARADVIVAASSKRPARDRGLPRKISAGWFRRFHWGIWAVFGLGLGCLVAIGPRGSDPAGMALIAVCLLPSLITVMLPGSYEFTAKRIIARSIIGSWSAPTKQLVGVETDFVRYKLVIKIHFMRLTFADGRTLLLLEPELRTYFSSLLVQLQDVVEANEHASASRARKRN